MGIFFKNKEKIKYSGIDEEKNNVFPKNKNRAFKKICLPYKLGLVRYYIQYNMFQITKMFLLGISATKVSL